MVGKFMNDTTKTVTNVPTKTLTIEGLGSMISPTLHVPNDIPIEVLLKAITV